MESHTNNSELKVQTDKKCSDDDSDTEEVGSDTETIDVSIDLDVHSVGNDIAPQNVSSICLLHLYQCLHIVRSCYTIKGISTYTADSVNRKSRVTKDASRAKRVTYKRLVTLLVCRLQNDFKKRFSVF